MNRATPSRHEAVALAALLTASVAGTVFARAATQATQVAPPNLRRWSVAEGLPQATVTALAQTPDGYLWIGTDAGLARFDGAVFSVFGAAEAPELGVSRVRALLVDRKGTLWIGIDGGAGLVHRVGDRFDVPRLSGGGPGPACISLFEDAQGRVWCGSWGGLAHVTTGGVVEVFRPREGTWPRNVSAIAQDRRGRLWIGSSDGGLMRLDGDRFRQVPLATSGAAPWGVTALLSDGPSGQTDGMWVGTAGGGLFHVGDTGAGPHGADAASAAAPPGFTTVTALARDRAGDVWVAAPGLLGRLRDGAVVGIAAPSLPRDQLLSLHGDATGGMWVGTRASGLVELRAAAFTALPWPDGSPRPASALHGTSDGSLFAGIQGGGLARMRDGRTTLLTTADGLCTDTVWAMAEGPPGQLWIGGTGRKANNLCRLDLVSGAVHPPPPGLPAGEWIRALTVDRQGRLWIGGAAHGLFRADRSGIGSETLFVPRKQWDWLAVYSLREDRQGRLWAGTNQGLFRHHGAGWTRFVPANGLSSPMVMSITETQDGTLWMGTFAGFTRFTGEKFTPFRAVPGIGTTPVLAALNAGPDLWLATTGGIFRLRTGALDDGPAEPMPVRYGAVDGLGSDRVEGGEGQAAAFADRAGRLWFATSQGIAAVDPARLRAAALPLPVIIDRALSDGRPLHPTGANIVPAGARGLAIRYAAIRIDVPPDKIRFRHRLLPFDRGWHEVGGRREATYTNLPPGDYRFEVTAALEDGGFARSSALLRFTVRPRLHQTLPFRCAVAVLLIACGIGVGWGVHRWRIRHMEAGHAAVMGERNRIARELHDSLAQGFTGVSVQLEAASRALVKAPQRVQENLDQARSLVRASLADARRAVWDLRPAALDGRDFLAALTDVARSLGAGVPIRVQVDGPRRTLPAPTEAALVRVAQEALTNAVRHAGASQIALEISFGRHEIELRIRDNGAGFTPDGATGGSAGLGLAGLRERVAALGGNITIDSVPGKGTAVTVVVPAVDPDTPAHPERR